jgi:hypothetical protein
VAARGDLDLGLNASGDTKTMSQLPPPQPAPPRNGCLVALMVVAGILLLLPGLCAILMIGFDPAHTLGSREGVMSSLSFLAVSAGGIALIWIALRGR